MPSTSPTLLGRLRDVADPRAWQAFERRYGPRILAWCRDKGLQQADAENVAQEVLMRVAKLMRSFVYKPGDNFSGLLRTIWRNAWLDYIKHDARIPGGKGSGSSTCPPELLAVADDELPRALEREFEREELHEAMTRVQPIVSQRDWQLFTEVDFGGRRTSEVAAERGLTVAAVGMAVKRVRDKVKEALVVLRG